MNFRRTVLHAVYYNVGEPDTITYRICTIVTCPLPLKYALESTCALQSSPKNRDEKKWPKDSLQGCQPHRHHHVSNRNSPFWHSLWPLTHCALTCVEPVLADPAEWYQHFNSVGKAKTISRPKLTILAEKGNLAALCVMETCVHVWRRQIFACKSLMKGSTAFGISTLWGRRAHLRRLCIWSNVLYRICCSELNILSVQYNRHKVIFQIFDGWINLKV